MIRFEEEAARPLAKPLVTPERVTEIRERVTEIQGEVKTVTKKRGRPSKPIVKTSAEKQRAYRSRAKAKSESSPK